MTAPQTSPQPDSNQSQPQRPQRLREVRVGDQQCPRCHETFTMSYWSDDELVQARCLSCDLKWPLPHVV